MCTISPVRLHSSRHNARRRRLSITVHGPRLTVTRPRLPVTSYIARENPLPTYETRKRVYVARHDHNIQARCTWTSMRRPVEEYSAFAHSFGFLDQIVLSDEQTSRNVHCYYVGISYEIYSFTVNTCLIRTSATQKFNFLKLF